MCVPYLFQPPMATTAAVGSAPSQRLGFHRGTRGEDLLQAGDDNFESHEAGRATMRTPQRSDQPEVLKYSLFYGPQRRSLAGPGSVITALSSIAWREVGYFELHPRVQAGVNMRYGFGTPARTGSLRRDRLVVMKFTCRCTDNSYQLRAHRTGFTDFARAPCARVPPIAQKKRRRKKKENVCSSGWKSRHRPDHVRTRWVARFGRPVLDCEGQASSD